MNTPVYSLRMAIGLRRALDLIASRDRRSTSNLMALLLEAAIREAGLGLCPDCNASGIDPASNGHREQCESCDGNGFIIHRPESSNRDKPSHAN